MRENKLHTKKKKRHWKIYYRVSQIHRPRIYSFILIHRHHITHLKVESKEAQYFMKSISIFRGNKLGKMQIQTLIRPHTKKIFFINKCDPLHKY